jgi:hypothetical protein
VARCPDCNWPSRDSLRGKALFEVIPGTVEEGNPTDTLHTAEQVRRRDAATVVRLLRR